MVEVVLTFPHFPHLPNLLTLMHEIPLCYCLHWVQVLVGMWAPIQPHGQQADMHQKTVTDRLRQGFREGLIGIKGVVTHGVTQDIHEV